MESMLFKIMDFKESRTYIKSLKDAPKGVQVKKGAKGGLYYEKDPEQKKPKFNNIHNEKKVKDAVSEANKKLPNDIKQKIIKINQEFQKGNDTRKHNSSEGFYSRHRRKLHDAIINEFLQDTPSFDKPKVIFVAGVPGSGKTSTLKGLHNLDNYVYINNDDIKEMLPEYQKDPLNAPLVHREASDIELRLIRKSIRNKKSIMLDKTFKSMEKTKRIIKSLKRKGYDIEMVATQLPTHESIKRAYDRMQRSGRYVPFELIAKVAPDINNNIHKLKKKIKSKIYNTNIPKGQSPIRIEKLTKNENDSVNIWEELFDYEDDAIIEGIENI